MARKKKDTTKTTNPDPKESAVQAALRLAALQGWENTTMRDIGLESGLSLAVLYDYFDDKNDIMAAYGRALDRQVLESFSDIDPETPLRDRLFDILMEHYDLMNQDRAALVNIFNSFRLDPKQVVIALPHLGASMARMLEAAGIDTGGLRGAARVLGLQVIYLWVLRTWIADESPDLTKTMASLDKSLTRADSLAGQLNL